jgi:phosphocarrier protein
MQQQRVIVQNEFGMHLRVAQQVAEAARRQSAQVTVCKGCVKANGCSIIELLLLEATHGAEIELVACGGDEERALRELAEVFSGGAGI